MDELPRRVLTQTVEFDHGRKAELAVHFRGEMDSYVELRMPPMPPRRAFSDQAWWTFDDEYAIALGTALVELGTHARNLNRRPK